MGEGNESVVQRAIREVSAGTMFPMLTKTNYSDWALLMKVKLRARLLWTAIEKGGVKPHEDRQALDALCSAVPPEMWPVIADKETAKEAWEAIATMRIGDDRVRKTSAQNFRRQFDSATFKDGESIEDYALRLNSMASTLTTLGDTVGETQVVEKIIRSVPQRFRQIVVAITTLLDLSTLTVADLTGWLKAAEDAFEPPPSMMRHDGKLYLTEEEWDARRKKHDAEKTSGGSSTMAHRGGWKRGRGRGRSGNKGSSSSRPSSDECRKCGKLGHWARDCRSKPKKEQAHVVKEEEEASLLLVKSEIDMPIESLQTSAPPSYSSTPQAEDQLPRGSPPPPSEKGVPINEATAKEGKKQEAQTEIHLREEKAFAHLGEREVRDEETWVLDTGATNHMTGSRTVFNELDTTVVGTVRFGDDSVARIEGKGAIVFLCKNCEHRSFAGAYYIPRLTTNIVSIGQLDEARYNINIKDGAMKVHEPGGQLLAKVMRGKNRLYLLHIKLIQLRCLVMRGVEEAWKWHARLGHVNMAAVRKMAKEELVRGLPEIGQVDQLCEACLIGKQKRLPFPKKVKHRARRNLELVHGDLCGPIASETPNGSKYFLLLVDDRSRYMWVVMLSSKDRAVKAIKEIKAWAEGESELKMGALRTDRGGEFTSHEFAKYCAGEGIHRQHTAPYSPQQNGVVERRNDTVVATARSMLKAKGLPDCFWGEAVATAVYLLNRCPTKNVEGMTPFEVWHGKKPAVHHLRVFGCIAYVLNTTPHLKKLEDRDRRMIFIGYESGSKAYRAYDPATRRVHATRDIVFDEMAQWDWGSDAEKKDASSHDDVFTVEYAIEKQVPSELDSPSQVLNDDAAGPGPVSPPSMHSRGERWKIKEGEGRWSSPPPQCSK